VRLRDGKILSDHPTELDPIHQDFLQRSLQIAQKLVMPTPAPAEATP
jgi:hypothetical protein